MKPPRGSSATFRGSLEPMKNTWFSRRWDAGGPPEGSFWPFLRPPVGSWRDPEAFLPYLRDFHGFRALRTGCFPRFWAAVGLLPDAPLGLFVPAWVSVSVDPVRAFFFLLYCRRTRQRMIYHLGISVADVSGRIRGCVVPDSSWVGSHVLKPIGVPGTYQKHVVFTVLRRCGASQGLPLASFWFPARSWPGMHCFPSYLDGVRGVRALPAWRKKHGFHGLGTP